MADGSLGMQLCSSNHKFCRHARGCLPALTPSLPPQLVMGLRAALRSPLPEVVQAGLHAIDLLVRCCPCCA